MIRPPSKPTTRSRLILLVALWAGLTVASAWLHSQVWGHETPMERTNLPLLIASNIAHLATTPGWIAMYTLSGKWNSNHFLFLLAGDGIGWAIWAGLVVILAGSRGALLRWWARARTGNPEARATDVGRRHFLVDAPVAAAGAAGLGLSIRAACLDAWDLKVCSYALAIRDLPRGLEGLKIVQFSDPHLGPRIPASFVREAVALSLSRKPDLILLTGDYIHNGVTFIDPVASILTPLVQSGAPVAGVLGNHDWYGDGRKMSAALTRIGVKMIDNGRVFLDAGTRKFTGEGAYGKSLCIGGLGDLLTDFVSMNLALEGVDPAIPRIVLAHNPDTAESRQCVGIPGPPPVPPHRIDLMLSGHTHGGQVRLPLIGSPAIPSRFGQKYAGGLVQGPAFPVVVSRGIGMSLFPVRFNVPPEVVEITLTRA